MQAYKNIYKPTVVWEIWPGIPLQVPWFEYDLVFLVLEASLYLAPFPMKRYSHGLAFRGFASMLLSRVCVCTCLVLTSAMLMCSCTPGAEHSSTF